VRRLRSSTTRDWRRPAREGRHDHRNAIIHSRRPKAGRAFLRDVLRLPGVDAGEGRLIFGLPPAEVAVHPAVRNNVHEFFLMCADVEAFAARLKRRGIRCSPVRDLGWGRLTRLRLPGGGRLGVYQARHARPRAMRAGGDGRGRSRKAGAA
jgi:hypothetical protein